MHTARGFVLHSLKQVIPAHQGALDEVRDKLIADLKKQKSVQLAQTEAEDLSKRVKAGEKFDPAAKALGFEPKTSNPFSRHGTSPGVPSGKQLSAAFFLKPGEVGGPSSIGENWIVYQIVDKTGRDPAECEEQEKTISDNPRQ